MHRRSNPTDVCRPLLLMAAIVYLGLGRMAAAVETAPASLKACTGVLGPVMDSRNVNFPEIAAETEVEVGQSMISALRADIIEEGLTLNSPVTFSGSYFGASYEVEIPAGPLVASTFKGTRVYSTPVYVFRYRNGKPRKGMSRPDVVISTDSHDQGLLTGTVLFGFTSKSTAISGAAFLITKCLSVGQNGFRHELIYTGVSHGTISFQYREFLNDMARPAFSQELKYDLGEGNEIGFKGARFQILKATNLGIHYKVLKALE